MCAAGALVAFRRLLLPLVLTAIKIADFQDF
jgi:hypothetical protein